MTDLVVAVDVGTGSARAGVFDRAGRLHGRAEHPIRMRWPKPGYAEQDSEDVWRAVCVAVRGAVRHAGIAPAAVRGLAFDAACSLVARDREGRPLSVAEDEESWDTIAWIDHRAIVEAEECTATRHGVLAHLGGVMSPEMALPKLMWLKRRMPERWARAGYFFDLSDYLAWRATGSIERSICTLGCKWSYLGHEAPGWRKDFLAAIGLEDLPAKGGLPQLASAVGRALGPLTAAAAEALGLTVDCVVGVGLIDAHAGALGVLGDRFANGQAEGRMALVAGTSSCLMTFTPEPREIPSFWGPHFGAVLPGLWVIEGGQSASGALLDHVISTHGGGLEPDPATHARVVERIGALRLAEGADFAAGLHVLPDFHGNRAPLAEPRSLGAISGLSLDGGFDGLCRIYWRTAVGIALGVRHILEAFTVKGRAVDTLHLAGGQARNSLLMALYADATGRKVVGNPEAEPILLGTAMAAAAAVGLHADLGAAAVAMAQPAEERAPDPAAWFERDYRVFLAMQEQQRVLAAID